MMSSIHLGPIFLEILCFFNHGGRGNKFKVNRIIKLNTKFMKVFVLLLYSLRSLEKVWALVIIYHLWYITLNISADQASWTTQNQTPVHCASISTTISSIGSWISDITPPENCGMRMSLNPEVHILYVNILANCK